MDVNISSMFIIYYFKYVVRACSVWKCRIRAEFETAGDVDEDNVWLLTDSPHETAGHTDEDNVWLLLTDCPHETAGHMKTVFDYFWLTVLMRQQDTDYDIVCLLLSDCPHETTLATSDWRSLWDSRTHRWRQRLTTSDWPVTYSCDVILH